MEKKASNFCCPNFTKIFNLDICNNDWDYLKYEDKKDWNEVAIRGD